MPRESPYRIVLSPEERSELVRRAMKYTARYYHILRAKMILLAAEGFSTDEIDTRLDIRREIVWKWRKRFFEQRLAGLEEPPRPAAARGFFPPEFVVHVKALACELPAHLGVPLSRMSTSDVAAEARAPGLVARISDSPVRRRLFGGGH